MLRSDANLEDGDAATQRRDGASARTGADVSAGQAARRKDDPPEPAAREARDDKTDKNAEGHDSKGDAVDTSIGARLRRHWVWVLIGALILIAAIVAGVLWWLEARHFESTDDAFIDGRPVAISPQITGSIVNVAVTDNQVVHAGDLLAEIDARDYLAAVQQAQAQIAQAEASVNSTRAQIDAQRAQVEQTEKQIEEAQAALSFAKDQDARAQDLVKKGAGTVQNAQQTASDLAARQAAFWAASSARNVAQRQIDVLQAQVKTGEAQIAQAEAQKATADANLARTRLSATMDGRIARLTAAPGAYATPGQALMILVPSNLWVTANFKETQLADMRQGQPAEIEIDAYGHKLSAHVDSIQSGSGTAFSLLPAENATGNFVKVVQRVPVKLTFDQTPEMQLGPGMSVAPRVRVR